jgi:hypothetical protein
MLVLPCHSETTSGNPPAAAALGPTLACGLGRLHVFPGDDVGGHNKLRRLFGIATPLDYESVDRLVARWHPYAGVVYFHLLLDTLSQHGLVAQS